MGQRLLLAITLLIVARTVTFLSPLPAEFQAGAFPHSPISDAPADSELFPPDSPVVADPPSIPADELPFSSLPDEDTADSPYRSTDSGELSPPDFHAGDRNETNPVQSWEDNSQTFTSDVRGVPLEEASVAITQVCEALKPAVVTVHAGREIGSGSIVSTSGMVITNHHVVRRLRNQTLSVKTQDGNQYVGQVIASDRPNDLALIQLQTSTVLPTVPVAAISSPTLGETVCAIGSPLGRAGTITSGRVVRVLPNGDVQSDVELKPGNSGGPLINARGEMIGVNKGVARSQRGFGGDAVSRDRTPRASAASRISFATNAAIAGSFIDQYRTSAFSNRDRSNQ